MRSTSQQPRTWGPGHFNFMTYQSNVAKLISDWIAGKPGEKAEEVHDKVRKASSGWAPAPSV
jgi:hypothetical protein